MGAGKFLITWKEGKPLSCLQKWRSYKTEERRVSKSGKKLQGGSSLKRQWKTEGTDGANLTWQLCPSNHSLTSVHSSKHHLLSISIWTLKTFHLLLTKFWIV